MPLPPDKAPVRTESDRLKELETLYRDIFTTRDEAMNEHDRLRYWGWGTAEILKDVFRRAHEAEAKLFGQQIAIPQTTDD
jgi:hypothetical protein